MKVYKGIRHRIGPLSTTVTVDGRDLDPRYELANHSPGGFEWGYYGSGPSQLALAILTDLVGDALGRAHYQKFKDKYIATIKGDYWTLTLDPDLIKKEILDD